MKDKKQKLVNIWDPEYNELAETFSCKLVCDKEIGNLLCAIAYKESMSPDEMAIQLAELLERSIYLNLPRSHRFWKRG